MCKTHTDSRIFLIADTHFGDDNIRLYEERPFPDTDTMDLEMIRRWNSVVGDHDLVYHLGDFCSGGQERCRELLSRLKGRKFLVGAMQGTSLPSEGTQVSCDGQPRLLSVSAAVAGSWL